MIQLFRALASRRLDPASRLLLGQLVMFTGIAAIFPVVPLYVKAHGGNSLDVALFIAGPMVANMLVQMPAGYLVDRLGRKPVLIASRFLYSGLAFALFLNLGPLWLLALFRCGQGVAGGGYVPALRAALADLTPDDRRAERYSQLQAVEMVGLLVGPAIGGAIALWTYSAIFLCASVGTLVGVTALFRLPETRSMAAEESRHERAAPRWWAKRAVIVPCIGLMCAGALFSMYDVVWPQYLSARHIGPFLIGLSISIFAVPVLVLATRAGRLSDRVNRRALVTVALLIVACSASLYPELQSYFVILGVGLVEALGFMLVEPTLYASLSESASADIRGRAMGVAGFFQFAGGSVGAGALGAMYGISHGLPFWTGAGACVMAAVICGLFLPARRSLPANATEKPQLPAKELEAIS